MQSSSNTYDTKNIFAKILNKEIPAKTIYENEYVLAFYDVAPKAPIHALIIPKNPYISYDDFAQRAAPEEIVALTKAVSHVANLLDLKEKGYRIISNIGKNAGQEIFHFHIHILGGEKLPFI